MGSFTRSTAPFRMLTATTKASSHVERIAEEAESAADAADHVRVKVARHGKASRKAAERTRSQGGAR